MMKIKEFVFALMMTMGFFNGISQISKDYGEIIPNTQFAASGVEAIMTEQWLKSLGKPINPYDEKIIQGSPYFEGEFTEGAIFYNGEKTPKKYYLRYNAFRDLIEVKQSILNDEQPSELLKSANISCRIGNKAYYYTTFKDSKGRVQQGYITEEYTGKELCLYARKAKIYVKGKTPANSLAQKIPPKFMEETNYLVGYPDLTEIQFLPDRKRKLIGFFSKKYKKDVSPLVKRKTFEVNSIDDLRQLLD